MPWVGGPDGGGLLVYLQRKDHSTRWAALQGIGQTRPLGTPPGIGPPRPLGTPPREGNYANCQVVLEVDGSSHDQITAATAPRLSALTAS